MNNAADVWPIVLRILRENYNLPEVAIDTWFADIRVAKIENDTVSLIVPLPFKISTIMTHHKDNLTGALSDVFGVPMQFELFSEEEYEGTAVPIVPDFSNYDEYSFEKFIVGASI